MDVLVKMPLKIWKVSSVLELLTVLPQEAQSIPVAVGTDLSHGLETKQIRPAEGRQKKRHFINRKKNNNIKSQKNQIRITGLGQVITA